MISNNSYSFNFMIINKNIIKINNHRHFETLNILLLYFNILYYSIYNIIYIKFKLKKF